MSGNHYERPPSIKTETIRETIPSTTRWRECRIRDELLPRQDPCGHGRFRGGRSGLANCYGSSQVHRLGIALVYVEAASYVSPTTEWETFDGEDLPNWLEEATMEAAKTEVDRQVQRVRGEGGEVAGAHARSGYPDAEIVDLAEAGLGLWLALRVYWQEEE